jgi:hypothetical protein
MLLRTLILSSFFLFLSSFQSQTFAASHTAITGGSPVSVAQNYGNFPLVFEANQGQTDAQVKFLSRGPGYSVFLTQNEAVVRLRPSQGAQSSALRMKLLNANVREISGQDELPGTSNYFPGSDPSMWHTNIRQFAKVRYQSVYPGVDLVYYGNQRQLEYDFVVRPGTDPSIIRLVIDGANRIVVERGDLVLTTAAGEMRLRRPDMYQQVRGAKRKIDGSFVLLTGNEVRFQVANYDRGRALIIDPILSYSTYLGGSGNESNLKIAVDAAGNAYVMGCTDSIDFPTVKAIQSVLPAGSSDVFVTKINASGTALVYSTYLGRGECAVGIAVDKAGNAYVAGNYGWVTKINANGSRIVYSTYVNASSVSDIAVDQAGNAYITGSVLLDGSPIYGTDLCGGGYCLFVTKINASGTGPLYSTYFSNWTGEWVSGIAVDQSGNAYVAGSTDEPRGGATIDGFVIKIDASGSNIVYASPIQPVYSDCGDIEFWTTDIAVDAKGNAYVTGYTVPIGVAGMYDCEPDRSTNAWVTKINTNSTGSFKVGTGPTLGAAGDSWASVIGGTGDDWPSAIAVDGSGNAYITGYTQSNDFPTVNALQRYRSGGTDAFVTKISPNSSLVYSTYLGGHSDDSGLGIAVTPNGNAYVVGQTSSTRFNKSPIAFQPTLGGATDAFVTKIASRTFVTVAPATLGFGQPLVGSESAAKKITVTNYKTSALEVSRIHFEGANAADFAQVNTCQPSLAAGDTCFVWVTFKPSAKGTRRGFLVINDADPASPQAVVLSGTGTVPSLSPKTLSFGTQAVRTTSTPRTTILTNTETALLNLSNLSITGTNAGDFAVTSDCGTGISGGASCKINVTFCPTATGSRSATVSIIDDGGGSPHKVTLVGTGN